MNGFFHTLSVLPGETWRALRPRAEREVEFTLADGTPIKRGVSECRFEIRGEAATSPVVLGEAHDGALLGAVTLETLGFMLKSVDPGNPSDAHGSFQSAQLQVGEARHLYTRAAAAVR